MFAPILEQFSRGKALDGYSEDRLIQTPFHFGVLDGSRGPAYDKSDVISAIMDAAVALMHDVAEDITLEALVDKMVGSVCSIKQKADFEDFRRSGGYVFCLFSRHYGEIWRVGDCKFRNDGVTNAPFGQLEEQTAQSRAMILRSMMLDGLSVADIMAHPDYDCLVNELLYCQSNFLNQETERGSVGAIIGNAVPQCFMERHKPKPGRLVITSDGYPTLHDNLEATEQSLAAFLKEDPLCINSNLQCKGLGPGRVSFDDRTYISADVHPR